MEKKPARDYWAEGGEWQQQPSGHGGPSVNQYIKPIRKRKTIGRKRRDLSVTFTSDLICPQCGKSSSKVIDSRGNEDRQYIRRRRKCLYCDHRFTTHETIVQKLREFDKEARWNCLSTV